MDLGASAFATLWTMFGKTEESCGTLFLSTDMMVYWTSWSRVHSVATARATVSILLKTAEKSCDIFFSSTEVVACGHLMSMPSILLMMLRNTESSRAYLSSSGPQEVV